MFERLEKMKIRFDELTILVGLPEVVARQDEWKKLVKERASLEAPVEKYVEYLALVKDMEECDSLRKDKDKELADFAEEEYYSIREKEKEKVEELKVLLLPIDTMDEKNVIIEIRPGAGGEESALFGATLLRMYHRFAERLHWKVEDIDINTTELGGIKEATFMISAKGAYSKMKYESGVHRVQRVPETESQGRVHTSTVTVAVLPETKEIDFEIKDKDLKIDTYRSSGAGGQHVNKTDSAVRITHLPTNIVVSCQDERSQTKNKEKAMRVLKSRLYDYYSNLNDAEYAENRRLQVGTGDRSERIRTYNYPQGRVTDHRIGYTAHNLPTFLDGDMFQLIENLFIADQNAKLSKISD